MKKLLKYLFKTFKFPLLIFILVIIVATVKVFFNSNKDRNSQLNQQIDQYSYEIVNKYPHDNEAFTQGLFYYNGYLYESTGLYGESSLRKVDLQTGDVLEKIELNEEFFGEGMTIIDDKIYQLTWKSNQGFVYDIETFEVVREFEYQTEGWGLTHNKESIIMSDGTDKIYFYNIQDLSYQKYISVRINEVPLKDINELEYINGKIYANIWKSDLIALIDPDSGVVTGEIDLSGLLTGREKSNADVLNGIAYDRQSDRLFVTGKKWPYLYELKIKLNS